ncbi:hypothetical protein HNR47_002149 [Methylopila jiangsuensis]|nr:hypothetical protein [Methylopila jiangsuensis]
MDKLVGKLDELTSAFQAMTLRMERDDGQRSTSRGGAR